MITQQKFRRSSPEYTREANDVEKFAGKQRNDVHSVAHKAGNILADALVRVVKFALHFQIKVCPVGFKHPQSRPSVLEVVLP